jgi:glutamine amidotransferase
MIAVVDIGLSNVGSVSRALQVINADHLVTDKKDDIQSADKIIFPGVGSFFQASKILNSSGLKTLINEQVLEKKIPILGICLGMQLLSKTGYEDGVSPGLGLIDAEVVPIQQTDKSLRTIHMGWNDITPGQSRLFTSIKPGACFYFVHGYEVKLNEPVDVITTHYGKQITAAVEKGHIYGVQFHPEKSQKNGIQLLKNFLELC